MPEAPDGELFYLLLFAAGLLFLAAIVAGVLWFVEYELYLDDLDAFEREFQRRLWAADKEKMADAENGK